MLEALSSDYRICEFIDYQNMPQRSSGYRAVHYSYAYIAVTKL